MQTNVLEYLEQTVQRVPDKTAFADDHTSLTFSELSKNARAIGSALAEDGLYGEPVVVFMEKSPAAINARSHDRNLAVTFAHFHDISIADYFGFLVQTLNPRCFPTSRTKSLCRFSRVRGKRDQNAELLRGSGCEKRKARSGQIQHGVSKKKFKIHVRFLSENHIPDCNGSFP